MEFEKQEELRTTYSLIQLGLLALRNAIEAVVTLKATGDPFFDENEEAQLPVSSRSGRTTNAAASKEFHLSVKRRS